MFYNYFNFHPKSEAVHTGIHEVADYRQLLAVWKKIINKDLTFKFSADNFVTELMSLVTDDTIEVEDFYYFILEKGQIAPTRNKIKAETLYQRVFFLCLLHLVILQDSHKTYEGTFSERLNAAAG
jgi:hypothetical protein